MPACISVVIVMLLLFGDSQEDQRVNATQNIVLGAKKKKAVSAPDDDHGMFSIPLRHAKGSLWGMVGEVKVGDPSLSVEVMFDTQSSNTLMFHPDITDSNDGLFDYKTLFKKHNKFYDPKKSSSSEHHEKLEEFEIEYPDGSVYGGATVTDMMFVGPILIERTTFAWIDYMNKAAADNKGGDFDGIVGLGSPTFRVNSNVKIVTALFDNMAQHDRKDALTAPEFSFYVSKSGETGEITYGGHNKDLLAEGEEMVYVPALSLSKAGYQPSKRWEFPQFDDSGEDEPVQRVHIDDPDGILLHNNIRRGGRQLNEAEEVGALRGIALSSQRNHKQQQQQKKHRHKQQQQDVVWGMEFDEITLGDTKVFPSGNALLSSTSPYGITFPSRASFEMMTNSLVKYGAELTVDQELIIPCKKLTYSKYSQLPILTLHVVKERFPLVFTPKEYFPYVVSGHSNKKKEKMCSSFFGVQEGDPMTKGDTNDDGGLIIRLGIPFMQKYYVEYDYGMYVAPAGGMLSSSGEEIGSDEFFRPRTPAQIGIALSKGVEVEYKSTKKKKKKGFFGWGRRGVKS